MYAKAVFRVNDWLKLQDPSTPLYLCGLGLTSLPEIPPSVRRLYCYDNKLTKLPSLDKCVALEEINCSDNQLTSLPSLDKFEKLQWIECYNNLLTSLPSMDKCVNLIFLYCDNNPLKIPMNADEIIRPHDYFKRREIIVSRERIVSRSRTIYQELISVVWRPSQVEKWIALYGIDFEDFV